jgi:hypothetical protein
MTSRDDLLEEINALEGSVEQPGGTSPTNSGPRDPSENIRVGDVVWIAPEEFTVNGQTFPAGSGVTYGQLFNIFGGQIGLPAPNDSGIVNLSRNEFGKEGFTDAINGILVSSGGEAGEGTLDPRLQAVLDAIAGGSSGGGGRAGPTFVKPDKRLVEEAIKARLVALVGSSNPAQLNSLVDVFMSEARRNFDNPKQQIDPMASVDAAIEKTGEFKAIHKLRPESMDKFEWVSDRRGAMIRAGVAPTLAEDLAIKQATVGATVQDATRAGEVNQFQTNSKVLPGFFQSIQNSARSALRLL